MTPCCPLSVIRVRIPEARIEQFAVMLGVLLRAEIIKRFRVESRSLRRANSLPVLFIADLLHPIDGLAAELFGNGNVRHRSVRRGPVPVLLTGRNPDNISLPDFVHGIAPALHPAVSLCYDQNLPQRMRVPRSPGAGLKDNPCAGHPCRRVCLEGRVDLHRTAEVISRPWPVRWRATSGDLYRFLIPRRLTLGT